MVKKGVEMTARNIKTGEIYEGGVTFISSVVGRHRNTVSKWRDKWVKGLINNKIYKDFEIKFTDVIRK